MKTFLPYVVIALLVIIGGGLYIELTSHCDAADPSCLRMGDRLFAPKEKDTNKNAELKDYGPAPEFTGITHWLGSDPLTLSDLRGRVVLVDFWTYSCINCIRTLPYVTKWYDMYKDKGFVVVGVHTPEFAFEKEAANVSSAMERYGIHYPVAQDNAYDTWNAYRNQYWPAEYLVDKKGHIVYEHFGEGQYDTTETVIRALLGIEGSKEAASASAYDLNQIGSPEVYFGALRNEFFGSGKPYVEGKKTFRVPLNIASNTLYLTGKWQIAKEFAENLEPASVVFRYRAKNVYLVASSAKAVTLSIHRDGQALPRDGWGRDASPDGVRIKEERLYQLIQGSAYGEHMLEIAVPGAGLRAFTLTFE